MSKGHNQQHDIAAASSNNDEGNNRVSSKSSKSSSLQPHHEGVKDLITLFVMVVVISISQYLVGNYLQYNTFSLEMYFALTFVGIFTLVGGFELYFKTQRIVISSYQSKKDYIIAHSFIDDLIPFVPHSIYLYTFGDLFIMSCLIPTSPNLETIIKIFFGMLVVCVMQCLVFLIFPSTIPDSYRHAIHDYQAKNGKIDSYTFSFYQKMYGVDLHVNAIPSGHCSIATYLAMTQWSVLGPFTLLNPILIAISCVCTKQHCFWDTVVGIMFGLLIYFLV